MICAAGRGMSLPGCQPYTVRRSAEPMATRLKGGFLDGATDCETFINKRYWWNPHEDLSSI